MSIADFTLTVERLREILHYDPETGIFVWRIQAKATRPIGSKAGHNRGGYVQLCINQVRYYAHRLAWLYMTGDWPKFEIDHKNRIKNDNRWINLRDVTRSVNIRNTVRDNPLGQGVKKNRGHTWSSRITVADQAVYLGNHMSATAAENVFLAALALHGEGDQAMLEFARNARTAAAKTVAATKLRLVVDGETLSISAAALRLGVPWRTVYYRLKSGRYTAAPA